MINFQCGWKTILKYRQPTTDHPFRSLLFVWMNIPMFIILILHNGIESLRRNIHLQLLNIMIVLKTFDIVFYRLWFCDRSKYLNLFLSSRQTVIAFILILLYIQRYLWLSAMQFIVLNWIVKFPNWISLFAHCHSAFIFSHFNKNTNKTKNTVYYGHSAFIRSLPVIFFAQITENANEVVCPCVPIHLWLC